MYVCMYVCMYLFTSAAFLFTSRGSADLVQVISLVCVSNMVRIPSMGGLWMGQRNPAPPKGWLKPNEEWDVSHLSPGAGFRWPIHGCLETFLPLEVQHVHVAAVFSRRHHIFLGNRPRTPWNARRTVRSSGNRFSLDSQLHDFSPDHQWITIESAS